MPHKGDKGDKSAARPPKGSLVETKCLIKGPKSAIVPFAEPRSEPKSRTGSGASQKAKSQERAPKLIFFIPISAEEKGCYFRFRILANHLASFFFLHLFWQFVRTTISSTRARLRGTDSLTYILYFLQQASQSWPTFLIPLLMVSLWRPVNSNTEGLGKFLISLLSVVDHMTIYIYIYIYIYILYKSDWKKLNQVLFGYYNLYILLDILVTFHTVTASGHTGRWVVGVCWLVAPGVKCRDPLLLQAWIGRLGQDSLKWDSRCREMWHEHLKKKTLHWQFRRKGTNMLKNGQQRKSIIFYHVSISSIYVKPNFFRKSCPYILWTLLWIYIVLFVEC